MAEVQYSFFCLGYDESKGAPTFQFVVHDLPLGPFPYSFPDDAGVFLVNGFTQVEGPTEVRLALRDPRGAALIEQTLALEPDNDSGRLLSVAFLEALTFPTDGDYTLEVFQGERRLTRHVLSVVPVEMA